VPNGQAFAPFGERYAVKSTPPGDSTGMMNDTASDLYDFLYREQHNGQGRWISPDPAGLAAADPLNPQTWNRYAYVANNPLNALDPLGLFGHCTFGGIYPNCADPEGGSNGYPLSLATPGGRAMIYYPVPACQTFFLGTPFGTGTTIPICP